MRKIDAALHDRLNSLINSMGYDFFGSDLQSHGRSVVFRIYIDGSDGSPQKGVTVEDCSKVSRQVSAMLDVEDFMQGQYTLEVSSPGVDRPLLELAHYVKYVGGRVNIKLHTPLEGRRQFKGLLVRVEGENIHILVDDAKHVSMLPFSTIEKANLIANISF